MFVMHILRHTYFGLFEAQLPPSVLYMGLPPPSSKHYTEMFLPNGRFQQPKIPTKIVQWMGVGGTEAACCACCAYMLFNYT